MLMVFPNADRMVNEAKIDKGMEIVIIKVERILPKNAKIINAVKQAAITPSVTTPLIAAVTNMA